MSCISFCSQPTPPRSLNSGKQTSLFYYTILQVYVSIHIVRIHLNRSKSLKVSYASESSSFLNNLPIDFINFLRRRGCQNWAFATMFGRLDTEMKPQELGRHIYIYLNTNIYISKES